MGRVWTIEERQKQAERIRSQKPWTKSTGPRTKRGKLASSRNAYRHGCYGTEFKMMLQYLRLQKIYTATLRFYLKHDLFEDETPFEISGNELNEKPIKSIQNDTQRHTKTGVKSSVIHFRHCEHSEAIQNLTYSSHSGLLRHVVPRNDNNPAIAFISRHPYCHSRAGGNPE